MALSHYLVDISLVRTNAAFRRLMVARLVSLLGLGLLTVAVPFQVHSLSGSTFLVGLSLSLGGIGLFIGILLGGVLADRLDRRRLILFSRSVCGLGYAALAVNSLLPTPSLTAVLVLSFWDGFFGAISITALMAAMPALVGRERLMEARALGMLVVRFATVISPAFGAALIAAFGLGPAYGITTVGTLLTVLVLLGLPPLPLADGPKSNPLRMIGEAVMFLFGHRVVAGVVLLATLLTMSGAVRVLFPALVEEVYGGGVMALGILTSMIPLGATLGAVVSGWATRLHQPGRVMGWACLASFACLLPLGLVDSLILAAPLLIVYGYTSAIAGLVQYTMIQGHTPDALLGRVNSLWTAQEVSGDSLAALGIGLAGKLLTPGGLVTAFGGLSALLCLALLALFRSLHSARLTAARGE